MGREAIYDVIIIGAGPAGVSAAIWCKRLGLNVLVLEQAATIGGQLHQIHNQIIDYPGTIINNGSQLNQLFEEHLVHLEIKVKTNCIVNTIKVSSSSSPSPSPSIIVETDHASLIAKYVLMSTGSRERRLGIPGEQEMLARGEMYSSKKNLEQLKDKRVLIVGGGDRALEGACNIATVAKSVLLVHRNTKFRARQEFLSKIPHLVNVKVETSTVIEAIHGSDFVEAATLVHLIDGNRNKEEIDAVIIRIGREPAHHAIPSEVNRTRDGFIIVDSNGRTNIENIFAVGDLVNQPHLSSITNSVGQGMRAARTILVDIKKEKERHSDYGDLS